MSGARAPKRVVVTGAAGFIGRNLIARLAARGGVEIFAHGRDCREAKLRADLAAADTVFHLAGVNRPERVEQFMEGNVEFTHALCRWIAESGRRPHVIFTSSIQAACENPYGASKRAAEELLAGLAAAHGVPVSTFRLKNVFGKWCRPNYNSVVATFCHNIGRDLPITVSDPAREVELVHVDDVVDALLAEMERGTGRGVGELVPDAMPSYTITLGELAGRLQAFREMQQSLRVPDFSVRFNRQLYATFLSYLEPKRWQYGLEKRADARGDLAEFIKSPWFGQLFVSRTHPGVTRGNHYHHTKTEKFLVLAGEAVIRFRHIEGSEVVEHRVRGEDYRVVDIPPGYTHSITNVGDGELITLFWASEVFDPDQPDTYFLPVELPLAVQAT